MADLWRSYISPYSCKNHIIPNRHTPTTIFRPSRVQACPCARIRTQCPECSECPECPECPVSDWTVTHMVLSDLCPVLSDQCPIYVRLMSDCVSDHVRKPCPVSVRNVRQCPAMSDKLSGMSDHGSDNYSGSPSMCANVNENNTRQPQRSARL